MAPDFGLLCSSVVLLTQEAEEKCEKEKLVENRMVCRAQLVERELLPHLGIVNIHHTGKAVIKFGTKPKEFGLPIF